MRSLGVAAFAATFVVGSALWLTHDVRGKEKQPVAPGVTVAESTEIGRSAHDDPAAPDAVGNRRSPTEAVQEGLRWLASTQGSDGGWGQDGGETSYVRQGENLETTGNDLANTAVAALAFLHGGSTPTSGSYAEELREAVDFVLRGVEQAPADGPALRTLEGTQIQRKLGPFIDTFLTSRLLSELDGESGDPALDERVRAAPEVCVRKIEAHQQDNGSWNLSGGWAPILGTSLASRSLDMAKSKGLAMDEAVMARVDDYTETVAKAAAEPTGGGSGGGVGVGAGRGVGVTAGVVAGAASAGVALYRDAQILEQLSRTEEDRRANRKQIAEVVDKLDSDGFQAGFGSMGGEEFFSYLNISDSLKRTGGEPWKNWNGQIQTKLVRLQNGDGSWAGHHCITGRVAVTGAAVLTLVSGIS